MGIIIIGPDGEIEREEYDDDTSSRDKNERRAPDLRERFGYIAPGLQPVISEEKRKTPPPPFPLDVDGIIPAQDTPKGPTIH